MRRPRLPPAPGHLIDPASGPVDSLQRGLEVLRCFGPADNALEVAEVARRMSLSRPTTRRLLDTLEQHGFLLRQPATEQYGLHVACLMLGQAVLGNSALVKAARPLLQPFAERFGVQAMTAVQERSDLLVMSSSALDEESARRVGVGVGLRVPLRSTALGHAWLWAQGAQAQAHWLARLREEAAGQPGLLAGVYRSFQALEEQGTCQTQAPEPRAPRWLASPVPLLSGAVAVVGCLVSVTGDARDDARLRACAGALPGLAARLREAALKPAA